MREASFANISLGENEETITIPNFLNNSFCAVATVPLKGVTYHTVSSRELLALKLAESYLDFSQDRR